MESLVRHWSCAHQQTLNQSIQQIHNRIHTDTCAHARTHLQRQRTYSQLSSVVLVAVYWCDMIPRRISHMHSTNKLARTQWSNEWGKAVYGVSVCVFFVFYSQQSVTTRRDIVVRKAEENAQCVCMHMLKLEIRAAAVAISVVCACACAQRPSLHKRNHHSFNYS